MEYGKRFIKNEYGRCKNFSISLYAVTYIHRYQTISKSICNPTQVYLIKIPSSLKKNLLLVIVLKKKSGTLNKQWIYFTIHSSSSSWKKKYSRLNAYFFSFPMTDAKLNFVILFQEQRYSSQKPTVLFVSKWNRPSCNRTKSRFFSANNRQCRIIKWRQKHRTATPLLLHHMLDTVWTDKHKTASAIPTRSVINLNNLKWTDCIWKYQYYMYNLRQKYFYRVCQVHSGWK